MSDEEFILVVKNTEHKICLEACLAILRELQKKHMVQKKDIRSAIEDLSLRISDTQAKNAENVFINEVKGLLNEVLD